MTKKEYILKVLDKVKGLWPKEQEVRNYLLHNDDQEYIDYLYAEFVQAVDVTLKDQALDKSQFLAKYLNEIKIKETASRQADQEDLQKLDQLLSTL